MEDTGEKLGCRTATIRNGLSRKSSTCKSARGNHSFLWSVNRYLHSQRHREESITKWTASLLLRVSLSRDHAGQRRLSLFPVKATIPQAIFRARVAPSRGQEKPILH